MTTPTPEERAKRATDSAWKAFYDGEQFDRAVKPFMVAEIRAAENAVLELAADVPRQGAAKAWEVGPPLSHLVAPMLERCVDEILKLRQEAKP